MAFPTVLVSVIVIAVAVLYLVLAAAADKGPLVAFGLAFVAVVLLYETAWLLGRGRRAGAANSRRVKA